MRMFFTVGIRRHQLYDAISDGDRDTVAALLREHPELIHQHGRYGETPLMDAVSSSERSIECIQLLLAVGADAHATTREGYNALHYAVGVDGPSSYGDMPMQIMKLLVDAGADLEARQHYGWTPLMGAVLEGTADEVRALLAVGANPNHVFPKKALPAFIANRTTLSAALTESDKLLLLLEAGADVKTRDGYGQTVLDYARQSLAEAKTENFIQSVRSGLAIIEAASRISLPPRLGLILRIHTGLRNWMRRGDQQK